MRYGIIFYTENRYTLTKTKNGVESIGKAVFRVCSNLTSIAIHNGAKNIEQYTFENSTALTKLSVGASGYFRTLWCETIGFKKSTISPL